MRNWDADDVAFVAFAVGASIFFAACGVAIVLAVWFSR